MELRLMIIAGTTQMKYMNRNGQEVVRSIGKPGTDHGQCVYVLKCQTCCHEYGANGSDIFLRRCPRRNDGSPPAFSLSVASVAPLGTRRSGMAWCDRGRCLGDNDRRHSPLRSLWRMAGVGLACGFRPVFDLRSDQRPLILCSTPHLTAHHGGSARSLFNLRPWHPGGLEKIPCSA